VSLARYAGFVTGVVLATLGLVFVAFRHRLAAGAFAGMALGAGLAAANTLAAYGLVRWAEKRSTNTFMGAVLGGMVGRMGVMLAGVVGAVVLLGVPKVPLALSLLSYFVFFLVFEIAVLQKQRPGAPAEAGR
jgi:hypothetical protein